MNRGPREFLDEHLLPRSRATTAQVASTAQAAIASALATRPSQKPPRGVQRVKPQHIGSLGVT
eukprot:7586500-Pyramimonas_sp.AAC.1